MATVADFPRSLARGQYAEPLAHDIGNPPFGHQGERTIGLWFEENGVCHTDFCHFDGNCQTFRVLTRLQLLNDVFGLNLTYATLAGLLKYPAFASSFSAYGLKKFGIFESDERTARDVWAKTGLQEGQRHPFAFVLEACDDIAYSVIDAEDTIKKGYASFGQLTAFLEESSGGEDPAIGEVIEAASTKHKEFKAESISTFSAIQYLG